jgi:hypothetical protein
MKLTLLFCILVLFNSCDFINPDERDPAFIFIDTFEVTTTPGQGTNRNGISELWVYANADIIGVFDVPAQIPLIGNGNQQITIFAGIKNNGIGTTRIRYPFFATFDTVLNLQGLNEYHLTPRFTYNQGALIDNSRNFETGNTFVSGSNNNGSIDLIDDSQIAADGNRCIRATVNNPGYLQFIDNTDLTMESGNTVFLEMDYSCNNTFGIGVYALQAGNSAKIPILYLTPTTPDAGSTPAWNKVYVDFGAIAIQYPNADYYRIYFESSANESATPTIFLDNLKIVNW